jgi:hypothetical protein
MENGRRCALQILTRCLVAGLLFFQVHAWAEPVKAPATGSGKPDEGFIATIMSSTQGNFGKLGIGAGYMGGGPYLDEQNVRRQGLHASLTLSVDGEPSRFQQLDVHEGQRIEVAGFRILVEQINVGTRGTVVLRLWYPPSQSRPASKGS